MTDEYIKWNVSYVNYLMDLATIPPSEIKDSDKSVQSEVEAVEPETEEELKAFLGL